MNRTVTVMILLALALSIDIEEPRGQSPVGAGTVDSSQVDAVSKWLSGSAIQFRTLEAGHGFDDLRLFKPILKNARIVALGEGTHGTREFFQLKHRMLEFLVKEMGFTFFVMEGGFTSSLKVNDYVLFGTGDINKALAVFGAWPWDTKEILAMIEWMREYNKTVPESRKVQFLGYDADSDKYAGEVVGSYLKRVAPDRVGSAERAMRPVLDEPVQDIDLAVLLPNGGRPKRSYRESELIGRRLAALREYLAARRTEFIRRTSVGEFETAMNCVSAIAQYHEIFSLPWVASNDPADSGIAVRDLRTSENVKRFLDSRGPSARMVLWAHNGHVATGPILPSVPSLGSYLRKAFGQAYYAVGFGFGRGSFQARNLDPDDSQFGAVRSFEIGSAPQYSVEWFLSRPGLGNYFVDLRSVPAQGAVADWLNTPREMRHLLGAGYSVKWQSRAYSNPIAPRDYYDGLVFVDKTTSAQPNPSGVRGPARLK